ncbi:MAG: YceI family protein [Deltaproteobacteria bacterium]|nr:MAG: YceI family protein [Deltaproteobacteria bacterium]
MPTYRIDTANSRVAVRAKSAIHDTDAVWDRLSGTVDADPAALDRDARAELTLDMAQFDAGDFLKNRKLRKDMEVDRYPHARFSLTGLRDVRTASDGQVEALAEGVLRWRDRQVAVRATGRGHVDAAGLDATAAFDLDVRELGMRAPRFLMFKVDDVVEVTVTLRAVAE